MNSYSLATLVSRLTGTDFLSCLREISEQIGFVQLEQGDITDMLRTEDYFNFDFQ